MPFLKATSFYIFFQLTTLFIDIYGQCPLKNNALPTIEYGFISNRDNIKFHPNSSATGYYDIQCQAGYTLTDYALGRVVCLSSGSWSTLPQCKSMGVCSIPFLFTYLQTAPGVRVNRSLSFIFTNGVQDDQALGGSNITVHCANGFRNIGGSLTIICTEANAWTQLPNCTAISTTTTTTVAPRSRCSIRENMWIFPNGYLSNTRDLTIYNDDTAIGSAMVSCSAGYVIDSVSNGVYRCNNGEWSPRPFCIKTNRCSLKTLRDFINDPIATRGLDISSQNISVPADEDDDILIGSYILFYCIDGYRNIDNNLNVRCNANGQWSVFPSCDALTTPRPSGRCRLINSALPRVLNGYISNANNIRLFSFATAEGFYDVQCEAGYSLDKNIGGRVTCLPSGSWSPLPQCRSTGRCSIPVLFTYLQTTPGVRATRQDSFIYTNGKDEDIALGGSNITIQCISGFRHASGSLTIICTESNSWTPFPNCTSISTTTTSLPPNRCRVADDTWTFPHGYLSNTRNLTVYDDDTAKGFLIVSCSSGYVMDSTTGGVYRCDNGVWSPRPSCTKTQRCSLVLIRSFLNDPNAIRGLEISSQRILVDPDEENEVLIGSYMYFYCKSGFQNTDNNLNVTCNANGQWSTYPRCQSITTTMRTTGYQTGKK